MNGLVSRFAGIFIAGALLGACATEQPLYSWNSYQRDLLNYYKNPGELEKFSENLLQDIEKAEAEGRVPPGLYAEYGYAMLERGEVDTAIEYFAREQEAWPEAAFLMAGVISRLQTSDDEDQADVAGAEDGDMDAAAADPDMPEAAPQDPAEQTEEMADKSAPQMKPDTDENSDESEQESPPLWE